MVEASALRQAQSLSPLPVHPHCINYKKANYPRTCEQAQRLSGSKCQTANSQYPGEVSRGVEGCWFSIMKTRCSVTQRPQCWSQPRCPAARTERQHPGQWQGHASSLGIGVKSGDAWFTQDAQEIYEKRMAKEGRKGGGEGGEGAGPPGP